MLRTPLESGVAGSVTDECWRRKCGGTQYPLASPGIAVGRDLALPYPMLNPPSQLPPTGGVYDRGVQDRCQVFPYPGTTVPSVRSRDSASAGVAVAAKVEERPESDAPAGVGNVLHRVRDNVCET